MSLPEPSTAAGREGLAALRDDPSRALVALDFDGTLAPVVERPQDARPAQGALEAVGRLSRAVGGVVVLTGRPAEVVVDLGGLRAADGLDDLVVLGHYGLERWEAASGELRTPPAHPGVQELREPLAELVEGERGTHLEDKGASLAVHTRSAPDPAAALARLRDRLHEMASRHGLEAVPGKHVLELRPPGVDKGSALREEVESRGARAVLFAGDDVGDVPAFDAVRALRDEGVPGLLLVSEAEDTDPSVLEHADVRLDGPDAVVSFLADLARDLSR